MQVFASYKVIAVDDDQSYLTQITGALKAVGIPCMPIHFPDESNDIATPLVEHARLVFSDLHLVNNGKTDDKANYGAIGALLERIIPDGGAPVLLVLWTRFPEEVDKLRQYLVERYHADKQPLAILALDKVSFSGDKQADLPAAIAALLQSMPAISALIHWERDVAVAADHCARKIYNLARAADANIGESLELLLSQLAVAATGIKIAQVDPGSSVHDALLPLLADQISNVSGSEERRALWLAALPSAVNGRAAREPPSRSRAAAVNSSMHVADRDSGATGATRGAVIPMSAELIESLFERKATDLLQQFCVPKEKSPVWRAIQIEAACDYAQQKSPTIPYVLAVEVPASAEFTPEDKRPASIWISPVLLSANKEEVFLVANVKYGLSFAPSKAKELAASYRLRESLTSEIGFAKSQHAIRPGSVTLGSKP